MVLVVLTVVTVTIIEITATKMKLLFVFSSSLVAVTDKLALVLSMERKAGWLAGRTEGGALRRAAEQCAGGMAGWAGLGCGVDGVCMCVA